MNADIFKTCEALADELEALIHEKHKNGIREDVLLAVFMKCTGKLAMECVLKDQQHTFHKAARLWKKAMIDQVSYFFEIGYSCVKERRALAARLGVTEEDAGRMLMEKAELEYEIAKKKR